MKKEKDDVEVAISLGGENAVVTTNKERIEIRAGEHFKKYMADNRIAVRDDTTLAPLHMLHREWLHKKLDDWIEEAKK